MMDMMKGDRRARDAETARVNDTRNQWSIAFKNA